MKHKCWVTLVAVCCAFCVSLPGLARGQPSLLLDGNLKAGYQALDGLVGVQPGQRVAVEIYGKGVEGISGFSAKITYDAAQLSFDGFEAGQVIPSFTGLQTAVGSGSVSVGGASVTGVSGATEGRLGVVYFNAASGFSGNAPVAIESGTISTGPASSSVDGGSRVVVGVAVTGQIILDADLAPGIQAARNIVGVAAGDVVAVEIQGKDIAGVTGFSATLEYDAAQMAFVGFSATDLIPGITGLATESSGAVEVGAASVEGVAPAGGSLGVVRFQLQSGFTGSATIKLTGGRVSTGGVASDFQSSQVINVGQALGPMALDLNLAAGDQKRRQTTATPKVGDEVVIDIVAISGAKGQIGFQAVLKYDPAQLEYVSVATKDLFEAGASLPGNPPNGTVTINVAILGGTAASDAGSMAHATFKVLSGFTGETTVRLSSGQYGTTPVQIGGGGATVIIGGQGTAKTPDLDGSGKVDFPDFLIFARGFGKSTGEAGFDPRIDYDDSGKIDFPDFLFFAQNFGKTVGG